MHIHRRHPEVQTLSRLDFDRQMHSLFGVPVRSFCHMRAYDWSSLQKHIEEGHCQTQIALGYKPQDLLDRVIEEEPPDAALTD